MRWVVLAALVVACSGRGPRPVVAGGDGDYAATIADAPTWEALAARAGNEVMAHVEVVKVMLDRDGGRLYFMQSRRWQIHYDFADRFLAGVVDHAEFNEREYHAEDRRFVLGTVTHYLDQDVWTFELFAGDRLAIAETARVFAAIKKAVYFGDHLRYRPVPAEHVTAIDRVRTVMPVITSEELFANVKYEPLETGEAWGYLRIVAIGAAPPRDLHPYDIIVLGTQPLELAPVAAIVTDELQAPLGHLAVLAHSRGTPNMALRGASLAPTFAALDGKPVHLRVGPSDYVLELATPDDLARAARTKRAGAPGLKLDVRDAGLRELKEIGTDDLSRFGAKTMQLARVARLGGIRTPRAFGLSFHAYATFFAANGLDRRVTALLNDPGLRSDAGRLRIALDGLRDAITAAPVPAALTDPLLARIRVVLPGSAKVRLRSSTNAEDLAGFSGAGLYRSTRVDPQRADLERGLREVWASVWSWEAFAERDWYGIDHAKVAMAILVQESVDDDVVNGVAITGNPYFQGRPAIYINAQMRGGSVTGATGNELPEQLLYYTYDTTRVVERISQSSRAAQKQLLSDAEVERFAGQLERIHFEFIDEAVGTARAVDVEFLVRANRELVVVQARPYQMQWSADRRSDR